MAAVVVGAFAAVAHLVAFEPFSGHSAGSTGEAAAFVVVEPPFLVLEVPVHDVVVKGTVAGVVAFDYHIRASVAFEGLQLVAGLAPALRLAAAFCSEQPAVVAFAAVAVVELASDERTVPESFEHHQGLAWVVVVAVPCCNRVTARHPFGASVVAVELAVEPVAASVAAAAFAAVP